MSLITDQQALDPSAIISLYQVDINTPPVSFTASITGTVLNVTSISTGTLLLGHNITGTGILADTNILSYGTGAGGIGTYNLDRSQSIGSESMTGSNILYFSNQKNELLQDIVWQGITYVAIPIEVRGFEISGNGQFPRPSLKVSNYAGVLSGLAKQYEDLINIKFTRKRTRAKYLDAINFNRRNLLQYSADTSNTVYIKNSLNVSGDLITCTGSPADVSQTITYTTGVGGLPFTGSADLWVPPGDYVSEYTLKISSIYLTGTAQTAALKTLTLAADASILSDIYANQQIAIIAGTGAGQDRKILTSRLNMVKYSQSIDNATYAKVQLTVTANAATAPDGTNTMDFLVPSVISAEHYADEYIILAAGVTYAYSCHAKAGSAGSYRHLLRIAGISVANVYTDLSTGSIVVTSGADYIGSSIQNLGAGIYRITVIFTAAATGSTVIRQQVLSPLNQNVFSGDGTSGIYWWGEQLEVGSAATEYIHTEANPAVGVAIAAPWTTVPDTTSVYEILNTSSKNIVVSESRSRYSVSKTFDSAISNNTVRLNIIRNSSTTNNTIHVADLQLENNTIPTIYQTTTSSHHASADPNTFYPDDVYYINRKVSESRSVIEWELVSALDISGIKLPRRQVIQNTCTWKYRSPECTYAGNSYWDTNDVTTGLLSLDVCGKRLSSCKLRFPGNASILPYGGFPGCAMI